MTDEEIVQQIKDIPLINWVKIARKYRLTIEKSKSIVEMWQALQPVSPNIYKKEGKKLRKTKWNVGNKLYENYNEWKEAINGY